LALCINNLAFKLLKMDSKDFSKSNFPLASIALLPKINFSKKVTNQTNFYFMGLGNDGTKALIEFSKQNINGKFIAINSNFSTNELSKMNIEFFNFNEDCDFILNMIKLNAIISEKKYNNQNTNEHYVLLASLGELNDAYLSTALIEQFKREETKYTLIYSVPFSFESYFKRAFADIYLKGTQSNKNIKYVYADDIGKKKPNLKMIDVMRALDNEMYKTWIIEFNLLYSKK